MSSIQQQKARLSRALSQRLFLLSSPSVVVNDEFGEEDSISLSYEVLGTTDNVYNVTLCRTPSCTCPDFIQNKNRCKHIYFILYRHLHVPDSSSLLFQSTYTVQEFKSILSRHQRINGESKTSEIEDSKTLQKKPTEKPTLQQKVILEDDDCAICCENLQASKETLIWCKNQCGNSLHLTCFQKWARVLQKQREIVTCPLCRIKWTQ